MYDLEPNGTPVQNRSEYVLVFDAEDTNPNGDPDANNEPRMDDVTGQSAVTYARLKRYVRDQMDDDGLGVYLRSPGAAGMTQARDRNYLFKLILGADPESIDADSPEVPETSTGALQQFLHNAMDVRLFGAVMSLDADLMKALDEAVDGTFPRNFEGPLSVQNIRSMNRAVQSTETQKLSSAISSGSEGKQGTFAEDPRIRYGIYPIHGYVNENAAKTTLCTQEDIERLDTLWWRALKNQTLSNSKVGHQPRLYLRVEYRGEYYDGSLDKGILLDEASKPDEELRNISDVVLNIDQLLTSLRRDVERIEEVRVISDRYTTFAADGEQGDYELLYTELDAAVGEEKVTVLDPYEQA
jgi:CRISPR-associated protein Csh2